MTTGVNWVTSKPTLSFIPFLKKRASKRALEIAQQVWQGAVDRTPVGSGELRASWNLTAGQPSFHTVGEKNSSPGSASGTVPLPAMPKITPLPLRTARYFVSNGKGYAGHVEFGSISIQPHLMLARAVQAVDV